MNEESVAVAAENQRRSDDAIVFGPVIRLRVSEVNRLGKRLVRTVHAGNLPGFGNTPRKSRLDEPAIILPIPTPALQPDTLAVANQFQQFRIAGAVVITDQASVLVQ